MLLEKEDIPVVAMEFMNDVHAKDVEIINALFEVILKYEENPTSENKLLVDTHYQKWFEHTIEHFRGEEVQMQEKNFPPYAFHKSEHDNALQKMNLVFEQWQKSQDVQGLKQYFIEELPQWFIQHINSMDTVTASFLKTGLSPCSM